MMLKVAVVMNIVVLLAQVYETSVDSEMMRGVTLTSNQRKVEYLG